MAGSAFERQEDFIETTTDRFVSSEQRVAALSALMSPGMAEELEAEAQQILQLPKLKENIPKAIEAYEQARENKTVIEAETPLGKVTAKTIELNLEPREGQKTFVILGGAISAAENISTLGMGLAALGHRVLILPHVLTKQMDYDDPDFFNTFYKYEAEHGTFAADGAVMERIIAEYARRENIEGDIHLCGFSAGAPIMMQTAKAAQESELKDKVEAVHMISPASFYSPEQTTGRRRLMNTGRVILGFGVREGIPTMRDENERLLQMEAVGENERRFVPDVLRLAYRCTSSTIFDISDDVNIPIFIGIAASDKIFGYDTLSENITRLAEERQAKGLAPIVPFSAYGREKSHAYMQQGFLSQAITMSQMAGIQIQVPKEEIA